MSALHRAYSQVSQKSDKRQANDYYPTAPVATYVLLRNFDVPKKVWEPAAGKGWMGREIARCGHEVYASDLVTYYTEEVPYKGEYFPVAAPKDFLTESTCYGDAIITNPPYKNDLAEKFVRKAFSFDVDFVAMYCRITFLESIRRISLFEKYPPRILTFSGRVNCDENLFLQGKQLGGLIFYAWYVWDRRNPQKEITVKPIDTPAYFEEWMKETGGDFERSGDLRP